MTVEYKVGNYYDFNGSKVKIVDIDDRILVKWKDSKGNDSSCFFELNGTHHIFPDVKLKGPIR